MSFSNELLKVASGSEALAKIIHNIYSGAQGGLRFAGKHPKLTVGLIGAGAIGAYGAGKVLDLSKRVHPLYDIVENERKRNIMNRQVELLSGILDSQKKPVQINEPPKFIQIKPRLL